MARFIPEVRMAVFGAISGERDYQDAMQGNAAREDVDDNRSLGALILLAEAYLDKAKAAFAGPHPQGKIDSLHALRKTGALIVSAMERHGALPREGY